MNIIRDLSKDIKHALDGAERYVELAIDKKQMYPKISAMYSTLAQGELDEAMEIHKYAVAEIEEKRKTVTPPEYMLKMWADEHSELLSRVSIVKQKLDMLNDEHQLI